MIDEYVGMLPVMPEIEEVDAETPTELNEIRSFESSDIGSSSLLRRHL